MPEQSLADVYFLHKAHHSLLLHLETVDIILALCLGTILNNKIINKKHENEEKVTLS